MMKSNALGLEWDASNVNEQVEQARADLEKVREEIDSFDLDAYPAGFDNPTAAHEILLAAAEGFGSADEAVAYLRGGTSMSLPLAGDGIPVRVGDVLEWADGMDIGASRTFKVEFVSGDLVVSEDLRLCRPADCKHLEHETAAGILTDMLKEMANHEMLVRSPESRGLRDDDLRDIHARYANRLERWAALGLEGR